MLSVESVLDVISDINLVNDLVSILLQSSRENHDLIVLRHRFNKLDTARSDKEEAIVLVFDVVNKCLIEIEHKAVAVGLFGGKRVEERRGHFWQIGEVVGEDGRTC